MSLEALFWPKERLGDLVATLAGRAGLATVVDGLPGPRSLDRGDLDRWFLATSEWLHVDAQPVFLTLDELGDTLPRLGPAILRVSRRGDEALFLAVLGARRGRVELVGPDGEVARVASTEVLDAVLAPYAAELLPETRNVLHAAGYDGTASRKVEQALLRTRLSRLRLPGCWLLRRVPGELFARELRRTGVFRDLALLLAFHAVAYGLQLASWVAIGRAALDGIIDRGWLQAWLLLLATAVPFLVLESWLAGLVTFGASRVLKQRLLAGALRLDPNEIRHEGEGHLLGRVFELENLETAALLGAFSTLAAATELVVLPAVLAKANAAGTLLAALFATAALVVALSTRGYWLRRRWTDERVALTHTLVERMTGHRTRLVQGDPATWHAPEDAALRKYLDASRNLDTFTAWSGLLATRGWILVGMVASIPTWLRTDAGRGDIAIAVGALLLAGRTLQKLSSGLFWTFDAVVSWRTVRPLYEAAARREPPGVPALAVAAAAPSPAEDAAREGALLVGRDVQFRHPDQVVPVLRGVSFRVRQGDAIVLEGASGAGKSTLGALVTGLYSPTSGVLQLRGFDRRTIGRETWRKLVAAAPQFHENHVFTGTLAYNLLLARRWPAEPEDLADAEALCEELGLGPLLARMPAGLQQMVGESGWQLSHGERSRVYLARALLQNAPLVVLDESFAALDPETFARVFAVVRRRSPALLVIAHP